MHIKDMPYGPIREGQVVRKAFLELQRERRARNTFAMLALVGWVVALALLGHGGVM